MTEVVVTAGHLIPLTGRETDDWLAELADRLRVEDHVVARGSSHGVPVRRSRDGGWLAGDMIGELHFAGHTLRIRPPQSEVQPASLLAAIWCEGIEGATRHGPPAIHREIPHVGGSLRGRLDVRGTIKLRAKASSDVASVYRARDVRNPLSCALVAADRALTRQIGHDRWQTRRVKEILPQLHDAVGRRFPLPTLLELSRIRYSPITRPFREIAELSVRIVEQDPTVTTVERDRPQGILVTLDHAFTT